MIRASADSYGCSAWRPRSRGEPDKLGWACCLVCMWECECVRGFLTRQRQYCIFHSSCRLIGCDICLCRTVPSFLPSLPFSTPHRILSPSICAPHLISSVSLYLCSLTRRENEVSLKVMHFLFSTTLVIGDLHIAENQYDWKKSCLWVWEVQCFQPCSTQNAFNRGITKADLCDGAGHFICAKINDK